mmetsp:Transcript_104667/g.168427  ORF Transcript_104667/g.168427 Transcript_104667/m.168427 type:complete len:90 (+) Transcript_104667:62-331(+)
MISDSIFFLSPLTLGVGPGARGRITCLANSFHDDEAHLITFKGGQFPKRAWRPQNEHGVLVQKLFFGPGSRVDPNHHGTDLNYSVIIVI